MMEIIKSWSSEGQGMFFVFCILMAMGLLGGLGWGIIVLIRGYPPEPGSKPKSKDDDE